MKKQLLICCLLFFAVVVNGQSNGGTLSSNMNVCQGANNGILSVSNYSGAVTRWETSLSSGGPWSPMVFTANSYNFINLQQTTYFRVVVQLNGFPEATSNYVVVICDLPTVGAAINGPTLNCLNSLLTLTASSFNGNIQSWEYSSNNWITTNSLSTTSAIVSFSYTGYLQIRNSVKNGTCPTLTSNTLTVFPAMPSNGGNVTGTSSVCVTNNTVTVQLNNTVGNTEFWESSGSQNGPFNLVSGSAMLNTLTYNNLSQNTWFRATIRNANCASTSSPVFGVNVSQPSNGGSIIGPGPLCAVNNNGTLQLIGYTGNIVHWQSSNDGVNWAQINNNTASQQFSNLSSTRIYRAALQNGSCAMATSSHFSVNIFSLPTPSFTTQNHCAGSTTQFTNLTTGQNICSWYFGDSNYSQTNNPSHQYQTAGTFTIKLVATNQQGCVDSIKKVLVVYPRPVASFIGSDTTCLGVPILFTNASSISSGIISQTVFKFSDVLTTTSAAVTSHNFISSGNHSAKLVAQSSLGCKDSLTKIITIHPKPNTNFSLTNICRGLNVPIQNLSSISSGLLSHAWSFGNGASSTSQIPSYSYTMAGVYLIRLINTSDHNCTDTLIKNIVVHESPSVVLTATNSCVGSQTPFEYSVLPLNLPVTTTLSFGDGHNSNSSPAKHEYNLPGIYNTVLSATSDSGCVGTTNFSVEIYTKPKADFVSVNTCPNDTTHVTNISFITQGTLSYEWFKNGLLISNSKSPGIAFNNSGQFGLTLVSTSEHSCRDTATRIITIFENPISEFSFSNTCDGTSITFYNSSTIASGVIKDFKWNLGDNSYDERISPVKTYLNNGSYKVSLVSISDKNCRDTIVKDVTVFESPIANFEVKNVCLNTISLLNNSSVTKSISYNSVWQADNKEFKENSPKHVFSASGNYSIQLKVSTPEGCADSIVKFITVYQLPKVFAGNDTVIEKGNSIRLNASGAVKYNWYPTTDLDQPLSNKPLVNPYSDVTYFVHGEDGHGCENVDTVFIKVNSEFIVVPYNILTPDGNGLNDWWSIKNIEAYPENHVLILDQWNQIIYSKEHYNNEFEGKNLHGEILPDGTYYYILTFQNTTKKYTGFISLLRNR